MAKWFSYICMRAESLWSCPAFCDPVDCTHQAPLSMGFSRQEHWSRLPCPSPSVIYTILPYIFSHWHFWWLIFFNWRIITLRGCISFCCIMKWISYMYTYMPSLADLPSTPISCLDVTTEDQTELPVLLDLESVIHSTVRKRKISHMNAYMWNPEKMIQMNLFSGEE